jgi:hypothetical protein
MGNTALWVVEGVLCLPLGLLVWASQHVLNRLHPSQRHLLLGPVLPRVLFLLALLVATCLMATCLFLAVALSAPDWQQHWSDATPWQVFGAGCGLALVLVPTCASLQRMVQARRA